MGRNKRKMRKGGARDEHNEEEVKKKITTEENKINEKGYKETENIETKTEMKNGNIKMRRK
jgi:hypothetical protein